MQMILRIIFDYLLISTCLTTTKSGANKVYVLLYRLRPKKITLSYGPPKEPPRQT